MKTFLYAIYSAFLLSVFYTSAFADTLSLDSKIQLKVLEQKVLDLQQRIDAAEKNSKELEMLHRNETDKVLSEKSNEINTRMLIYVGFFLALISIVGGLVKYFGKEKLIEFVAGEIQKTVTTRIDSELKLKMSEKVIDEKITEFGKPIVIKLLDDLSKKREEYEKLKRELENKSKAMDLQKPHSSENEKLQKFAELLRDLKKEKDYTARDWFLMAEAEFEKNYEEAIRFYSKTIDLEPRNTEAIINRGLAKSELGLYGEAILDFKKAININPKHFVAYNNIGYTKNKMGEYQEAIKYYDRTIEINDKFEIAYNNRAVAYENLGKDEEASLDYEKVAELNPGFKRELYHLKTVETKNDTKN